MASSTSPSVPARTLNTPRPEDQISEWAKKYRGATVEDLDPPSALSVHPKSPISHALMTAFEREYTHLTVVSETDRALLGYISMPRLRELLRTRTVAETDPVEKAMQRFQRTKARPYTLITMDTPLEDLEAFFEGTRTGAKQDFAVVTEPGRKFVLGVATRDDLAEFVRRRPA